MNLRVDENVSWLAAGLIAGTVVAGAIALFVGMRIGYRDAITIAHAKRYEAVERCSAIGSTAYQHAQSGRIVCSDKAMGQPLLDDPLKGMQ